MLFLGDSVTYGWGMGPEDAYPRFVQAGADAAGRPLEVMNMAMPGWTTRQQRLAYERVGRKYRPDLLVVAVCLNDMGELQRNLARPPPLLAWTHSRSALVRLLVNAESREIRSVSQMFEDPKAVGVRQGFERFFAELGALQAEVAADGKRLWVVVFPYRFQYESKSPPPIVQERIASWAASRGIPVLDLLDGLRPLGTRGFNDRCHLSLEGAKRTSAVLLRSAIFEGVASYPDTLERAGVGSSPTPEALILTLRQAETQTRAAAAWALGRQPPPLSRSALTALSGALVDSDEQVRVLAARALARQAGAADPYRAAMFSRLHDPAESPRWEVMTALWTQGPRSEEASLLSAELGNEDPYVKAWAQASLVALGNPAVPALLRCLGNADAEVRQRGASALGELGSTAALASGPLAALLQDPDPNVRTVAARSLGRLGNSARDALEALRAARNVARGERRSILDHAIAQVERGRPGSE